MYHFWANLFVVTLNLQISKKLIDTDNILLFSGAMHCEGYRRRDEMCELPKFVNFTKMKSSFKMWIAETGSGSRGRSISLTGYAHESRTTLVENKSQ